jgi:hypothetical protein
MTSYFKRGEFTALVGGMTVVWPLAARVPRAEGNLSMSRRNVNRADEPVRTLGGPIGDQIAAGLAGREDGEAMALTREA